VPTKHASAVALEAFTEAALAARRHPAVVCSQGLALSALRDDSVDVLGLLAAHGTWPRRAGAAALAGATAADLGVLDHAVEDDPGGVVVLRGLRWRLSRQVVPRLGPAMRWPPARAGTARPVRSSA